MAEPAETISQAPEVTGTSILKRIATYAPGGLVPAVLTLVTSMVFTRIFDPVAFGTYSLFLVVAQPVRLVFTTWLTQSIGRFLPPEQTSDGRRQIKDAIFLSTAMVFVVESALGVVVLAVGSRLLPVGWRSFLLPVVLFIVVTSLFEVVGIIFPVEYRAREFVAYKLLDSVATFGLRLLLVSAIFRLDIELMFWSVVLSNAVLLPVMWARAGLAGPVRLGRLLRRLELRRQVVAFLGYGMPMTLWFFSSILLDVGDRYVLNMLVGPGAVGVYDANYRLIAGLAALLVVPITMTLHPYLMAVSSSEDRDRAGQVIGTVVEKVVLVGVLSVGLTFVLHADLARILLGPEFREGSVVMPLVLAGVFAFNVGTFVHKPFEIVGRTRVMVVFGLAAAVANIVFCFLLVPGLGYEGAAYATLLSYLLYTISVGALGRRVIRWRLDARLLLAEGGIIGAGVLAIYLLRGASSGLPPGWELGLSLVAAGVLTGVSLLRLVRRGVSR